MDDAHGALLPPPGTLAMQAMQADLQNDTYHVLETVLLLALAIADAEFVARETIVLLQQERSWQRRNVGGGEGSGGGSGVDDVPRPATLELALTRELQLRGRWPLLLLSCCKSASELADENVIPAWKRASPSSPVRPRPKPVDNYIVVATSSGALASLLTKAARQPSWNPTANFLVLLVDDGDRDAEDAEDADADADEELRVRAAVTALWTHLASRQVLVVARSLAVYAWSAYNVEASNCDNTSSPTLVGVLGERDEPYAFVDAVTERRRLFPGRRDARDASLSGCALRYAGVAWPPFVLNPSSKAKEGFAGFERGVDVEMLRHFARVKNMTLHFVAMPAAERAHRWGSLVNGSWDGLLGMLGRGDVNLVLGGFNILPDRVIYFTPTIVYFEEDVAWWVPRPEPVPNWQLLYNALPKRAARISLVVVVLSVAVVFGLQRHAHRLRAGHVALSVLGTMLEMPPLFDARPAVLRLFYFASFVYYFHINIIFRTAITGDLTRQPYQAGPVTHGDLVKFHVEVGVSSTDVLSATLFDTDLAPLRAQHRLCELAACLQRLQKRRPDYGLLLSSAVMEYLKPLFFLDSSGMPYVVRLPRPALPAYLAMFLRTGDPVGGQINDVFLRLVQAGLPNEWLRRVSTADGKARASVAVDKEGVGTTSDDDGDDALVLTLDHLEGALFLLGLGLSLGTAAFLVELVLGVGAFVARRLSITWHSVDDVHDRSEESEAKSMAKVTDDAVADDAVVALPEVLVWQRLVAPNLGVRNRRSKCRAAPIHR